MRIVSGAHRGRTLTAPKGAQTRPTSDRVRESLFASLEGLGAVDGARVLDLFAGSGALGLEALSRGAASCAFVDHHRSAIAALRANVSALGVGAQTTIEQTTALRALASRTAGADSGDDAPVGGSAASGAAAEAGSGFDLVFADPPYPLSEDDLTAVLTALVPLLCGLEALVVVERSARSPQPGLPPELEVYRQKTYGETAVWLLQLREG